ncbi:protein FAM [Salix suchowensis]|nr:protein FAM [Salix suchowensis]
MDLETENRIAAILMKEAAELRQRAEREGVHVYLERPKVRARPNSRFLTATVLGVQQTNRAVELNEMWRVREKELELDDRLRGRSRHDGNSSKNHRDVGNDLENDTSSYSREDEGLRDEEVDEFLHSRVKRGRGAVGSRMDDTGPYLAPCPDSEEKLSRNSDAKRQRVVFGPEKPSRLKSIESSEEELDKDRLKKEMKVCSRSLDKKHSRKHRSKERSRDKKRKRKGEKRSKH